MLYLVKFTLIAVFFVNVNLTTAASSASQELDLDKITIKPLKTVDPAIFIDFFVETFLEAYKPFSLEVLGKTATGGVASLATRPQPTARRCRERVPLRLPWPVMGPIRVRLVRL